jgi:hypothetical protein
VGPKLAEQVGPELPDKNRAGPNVVHGRDNGRSDAGTGGAVDRGDRSTTVQRIAKAVDEPLPAEHLVQ